MTRKCDVAIVGGGIGGLTLAMSLLQRSVAVEVFEQDTELREIGAGIAIGGNATRLLQRLGIDLANVANVVSALQVRRWTDGEPLWSHPIGEWYRQEVGAPLLTLHRASLQTVLAAAVPTECIHLVIVWWAFPTSLPGYACTLASAMTSWRASSPVLMA